MISPFLTGSRAGSNRPRAGRGAFSDVKALTTWRLAVNGRDEFEMRQGGAIDDLGQQS
jgi:hypothetical protein